VVKWPVEVHFDSPKDQVDLVKLAMWPWPHGVGNLVNVELAMGAQQYGNVELANWQSGNSGEMMEWM
jgi:hypothetical protein